MTMDADLEAWLAGLAKIADWKHDEAKESIARKAESLGRSTPQLLPEFYEGVGRIYIKLGRTGIAKTMFGRAREAEQVYKLTVDPAELRWSFIEFAVAEALPAKAMSQHAKTLASYRTPEAALDEYVALCAACIKRGWPEYGRMPKDITRLAKAAKKDLTEVTRGLVREAVFADSIVYADAEFWAFCRAALVALAHERPDVRGRLLEILPMEIAAHDIWFEILIESGASAALTEPADSVDPQAVKPAAWLTRVAARRTENRRDTYRSARLLDLVSRMAARLRADGVVVDLFGNRLNTNLDLLDLCLAERVPLARRRDHQYVRLPDWLSDDKPGRRDLTAVAADDEYLPFLRSDLSRLLRPILSGTPKSPREVEPLVNCPGLRAILNDWLEQQVDDLDSDSLFLMKKSLTALRRLRLAFPQAERIVSGSVASALAASLRNGIFDEFGWPALDEVMSRLPELGEAVVEMAGEGWPALVLRCGGQLIVVGPEGVLLEHTLQLPPGAGPRVTADLVDGRLLVTWSGPGGLWNDCRSYWSNEPANVFDAGDWRGAVSPASLPVPGRGRFTGWSILPLGDAGNIARSPVHSDGTSYWAQHQDGGHWYTFDPVTGMSAKAGLPGWIAGFGPEVDRDASWLRPAVPGCESSPWGCADGLLGWRARKEPDGSWLGERIDGVRVRLSKIEGLPIGALSVPGGGVHAVSKRNWSRSAYTIFSTTGSPLAEFSAGDRRPVFAKGTGFVPPHEWWCCLRVRDETGSRALRSMTEDMARSLLEAEDPAVALASLLPEITHPELITGVLGMVSHAAQLHDELRGVQEMTGKLAEDQVDGHTMVDALCWIGGDDFVHSFDLRLLPSLATLGAFARQIETGEKIIPERLVARFERWDEALARPAAVAWRAASPFVSAEHRAALTAFLRTLARNGFTDGRWRIVKVVPAAELNRCMVVPAPDGLIWIDELYGVKDDSAQVYIGVQFSTGGGFALPSGWRLVSAQPMSSGFSKVAEFCAALESNGPLEWRPELVDELVERTGLSRGEAAFLLAGLPGTRSTSRGALSTEDREMIGMSTATLASARERFDALDDSVHMALLSAGLPADPAGLWTSGPDVAGIANEWVTRFGRRTPVPDDVLAKAKQELPIGRTAERISDVVNPAACGWLNTDARMFYQDAQLVVADAKGFTVKDLLAIRNVLPWLAYHLPAGSPVRAQLTRAVQLVSDRLRNPEFIYHLGDTYWLKATAELLHMSPDIPANEAVEIDGWLQVRDKPNSGRFDIFVRTSGYQPEHRATLAAVRGLITGPAEYLADEAIHVLLGQEVGQACSALASEGADPELYFQDPAVSVPDLVGTVAAKYTLDSDVAVLYLQLLALPDPTDANVARWTGWRPARLKVARAVLAETGLVVRAKRARAGRSLFLPGGWRVLKSPYLPIETWKEPLFGLGENPPSAVITPLGTVEQLFRTAWQRIEDGDAPTGE